MNIYIAGTEYNQMCPETVASSEEDCIRNTRKVLNRQNKKANTFLQKTSRICPKLTLPKRKKMLKTWEDLNAVGICIWEIVIDETNGVCVKGFRKGEKL